MRGSIQSSGAQLVALRPPDVLGSYSICVKTGAMAAGIAADAPVFSFRWTEAERVAVIHRVTVALSSLATGFTAGVGIVNAIVARAFTANDTGGSAVSFAAAAANSGKRRTGFRTAAPLMRIATTAALGAGTRTIDTLDLAARMFPVTTATNFVHLPTTDLLSQTFDGAWPLVLEPNEGFLVRATVPATGTWQAQVCVDWSEAPAF